MILNVHEVSELWYVRIHLVACDTKYNANRYKHKGNFCLGNQEGISLPSGAVGVRDQIVTSFTLLPVGCLDSQNPHLGPQQPQPCRHNILMNEKQVLEVILSLAKLSQVTAYETSMMAMGVIWTDVTWIWVPSPIRQVGVEIGPNLID